MENALLQALPQMTWTNSPTGAINFYNQKWYDYTGFGVLPLTFSDWISIIHPDDVETTLQSINESFQKGIPLELENRYKKADGTYRWHLNKTSPIKNERGEIDLWIGTATDIHHQKQKEEALRLNNDKLLESEFTFRFLIENATVAACLFTGKEMKIEIANDIMMSFWGKGNSVLGKPVAEAVPELIGQPFFQQLDDVFTTGKTFEARATPAMLEAYGVYGTYYFDFTFKAVRNAAGKIIGVMEMAVDVTEQVLAQQMIEKNRQELLSYFKESPVAIAIIDKENLTFQLANPFYGILVGRKPEEIINKPLLTALPELANQGFDKLLEQVIETGLPYNAKEVSVELFRNNCMETIYVDLTYQPRYEATDQIKGVMVVATDVTQQVLARKKVEESEARFRSLIEEAPVATCVFVGRDLKIEVANDNMIRFWGKGNSVMGKPLAEALPELQDQTYLGILDDLYMNGGSFSEKAALVHLEVDGVMGEYYFNYTYKALRDANGEIYGIINMAIDVTEQVAAQTALEESKAQLQFAIEAAELGTWELNPFTNEFTGNDRLKEWFGLKPEEKIELRLATDVIAEKDRDRVNNAIAEAMQHAKGGNYDTEYTIINPLTKKEIIVKAKGKARFDTNGVAYRFNGTLQDITGEAIAKEVERTKIEKIVAERTIELAEANKNLQRSNAELEQFAHIASHDLQEPLRKISTFSQLLEQSLTDTNERSKKYLDKINNSSARMSILIRDVLAYAQLSKFENIFVAVDLQQILKSVISDFDLLIEQKHAIINCINLPIVSAIPVQMSQLFSNLISNSLKYSRAEVSPVINITCHKLTEQEINEYPSLKKGLPYINIQLSDNGIGFEKEHAEKIFSIFQRLHGITEYAGTGIGLAVCRKIVENHHGMINATGSKKGEAVFNIILPERV